MNLILPFGSCELATKADLSAEAALVRSEMAAEFAAGLGETAAVRDGLASVRIEIATATSDLSRTFGLWPFASQAAVIAAVAVIVGFFG